jgi:CRP-like cAMP-binding protein/thioredoxin reductase/Na+-translocating ferredoxin:NAD+ oxidoreductase RNF subunit RnfB
MAERFQVIVVGSGPAGMSAAARAAARGMSHVLLEREQRYSETIQKYQRGKFVMATPDVLPLRSDIGFAAGSREEVLDAWGRDLEAQKINIRYGADVTRIERRNGAFTVGLKDKTTLEADAVVLGIGVQGNLRMLRVPGAELPFVQYQLDDPEEYADESIIVIGAGDSAIENAVALAKQNRVVIVNRRGEFARAKVGNLNAIEKAIESGRIECAYNSAPESIEPGQIHLKSPEGVRAYPCNRVIARLGADPPRRLLEACGVAFPEGSESPYPEVSASYETNVPGLYAIGAITGYPLIKQCMNQGYEVIETIAGNPVPPADEPLLQEMFKSLPGRPSVGEALEVIKERVPLFAGLTMLQLREFLLDSDIRVLRPGEVVFKVNDYGNTLFCVAQGEVEIELPPEVGVTLERPHVPCPQGEFFGEVGLIAGRRRAATVRAKTDCVLIELARRSALKLINSSNNARQLIERAAVSRQLRAYLSQELTDPDLEEVIATAGIKQFAAGDTLLREGDTSDDRSVYVIRSGSCTASRRSGGKDVVVAYVPAGHFVGEMALLRESPRAATIKAAVATETIRLDGAAFRRLLDRRPELRDKIERVVQDRVLRGVQRERDLVRSTIAEGLMGQGIGEATDVLLIDESLCIRCDNCEKACAESHDGVSRLDREAGPTFAMIHVPTSCRHCEHPHCMADCPPDSIHRAANGEVWIDHDTCIGCGNCAGNCPYGVIRMAATPPKKPGLLQWLLLGRGPGPGEDKSVTQKKKAPGEPEPVKLAFKCDMCMGIDGGPACVRACPTGAAIRTSPEEFLNTVVAR